MFSSGCEALCIEVCHHSFHGGVCGAQLTQPLLLSWNFHLRGHNNGYGYSSATSRSLHDDEEIGHWEKNVKLGGCWHLICALMCLLLPSVWSLPTQVGCVRDDISFAGAPQEPMQVPWHFLHLSRPQPAKTQQIRWKYWLGLRCWRFWSVMELHRVWCLVIIHCWRMVLTDFLED